MKYVHTNIIAKDWEKLALFYEDVFKCTRLFPERNLYGEWLEKATSIKEATIQGIHLRLPGYDDNGPTLEIFQYSKNEEQANKAINQEGYAHIAFSVDNIEKVRDEVLSAGGKLIGELITHKIEGAGKVSLLYLTDPEGNIIELQKWS